MILLLWKIKDQICCTYCKLQFFNYHKAAIYANLKMENKCTLFLRHQSGFSVGVRVVAHDVGWALHSSDPVLRGWRLICTVLEVAIGCFQPADAAFFSRGRHGRDEFFRHLLNVDIGYSHWSDRLWWLDVAHWRFASGTLGMGPLKTLGTAARGGPGLVVVEVNRLHLDARLLACCMRMGAAYGLTSHADGNLIIGGIHLHWQGIHSLVHVEKKGEGQSIEDIWIYSINSDVLFLFCFLGVFLMYEWLLYYIML